MSDVPSRALRFRNFSQDVILHPLQLALAAEAGACAVYLIACVVGAQLEALLGIATVMGIEAIVEVHTPEEVEFAVSVSDSRA